MLSPLKSGEWTGLVFQNVTTLTLGIYRYRLHLEWVETPLFL